MAAGTLSHREFHQQLGVVRAAAIMGIITLIVAVGSVLSGFFTMVVYCYNYYYTNTRISVGSIIVAVGGIVLLKGAAMAIAAGWQKDTLSQKRNVFIAASVTQGVSIGLLFSGSILAFVAMPCYEDSTPVVAGIMGLLTVVITIPSMVLASVASHQLKNQTDLPTAITVLQAGDSMAKIGSQQYILTPFPQQSMPIPSVYTGTVGYYPQPAAYVPYGAPSGQPFNAPVAPAPVAAVPVTQASAADTGVRAGLLTFFTAMTASLPVSGPRASEFWQSITTAMAYLRPDDIVIVSLFARIAGAGVPALAGFPPVDITSRGNHYTLRLNFGNGEWALAQQESR